ncbi:MAG: tRNA dihydrouridine synthase DusB [Clostridia bacterium]|nr:tRNA dihydrouridine synthase DusB [Oscillospiraceae bacterium]MBQ3763312.1 tRNA dihydrouridine synthase DusB [Clostridia bacterium]
MQFLGRELSGSVFLAPMAGVTDYAYRSICAQHGAAVTVTEMVSSRALVYQDRKSRTLLRKNEGSLCGAQIFGNDPSIMAEAAKLALEYSDCDFIDINMGCPMPKIANNGDGSAIMKDPALAGRIVRAVKDAVSVPVTVKTRLGWDKGSINIVPFAKELEANGADAITVHGRTKTMLYSGVADWDTIRKVTEAVCVPIVANGDIFTPEDILRCKMRSGASLFAVGRAAFGDPWIFERLNAALEGREIPQLPCLAERMQTALEHFSLACEDKGEHIACLEARKHLSWYLRGVAHSAYYKEQISRLSTPEEVHKVAKAIIRDLR